MEQEIKPSFSLKYFIFAIICTAILAVTTILVNKFFNIIPTRIITVQSWSLDILNTSVPDDKVEAMYFLKGDPKKKIQSLFTKTFVIRNDGSEGIEDLELTFLVENADASLLSKPDIKTNPEKLLNALTISKQEKLSDLHKHVWNISLLNPSESVVMDYGVYSEKKIKEPQLDIIARKKDWKVEYKSLLDEIKRDSFREVILFAVVMILAPIFFLLLFVPVYWKEWNRNIAVRENFSTFSEYYNRHFPPPIKEFFGKY